MHKRFSLRNSVFFRFFSSLIVFWLSVSTVWSQDSIKNQTSTVEIYITNNSFHVVGEAEILGNVRTIKVKTDKQAGSAKEFIAEKKSKDKIRVFKEKKIQKMVSLPKPKFLILPLKSENTLSLDNRVRRIFITQTDSFSFQKGKALEAKFRSNLQFYSYKVVVFLETELSEGFPLKDCNHSIIARPPPDIV